MYKDSFFPNLKQLTESTSDQTVGISLRIKDSTRSLFELEAKKHHTSTSAIINNLLDEYAKRYILQNYQQAAINHQTIQRYVETAARKAGTLDIETLLRDTMANYAPEALFESNRNIVPIIVQKSDGSLEFTSDDSHAISDDELIKDFTMWANGHPTRFFQDNQPYVFFTDGMIIALPPSVPASAETITNNYDGDSYINLCLPAPKWLIVITIISAFLQKNSELNGIYQRLGDATCYNIAHLANSVDDNAEFAKCIATLILRATSEQPRHPQNPQPTWVFVIVFALEQLGGKGSLDQIYRACREAARKFGKTLTKNFEATIRGVLESHSSDSKKFNGKHDYFSSPENGSGFWTLNPGVHADVEKLAIVIPE